MFQIAGKVLGVSHNMWRDELLGEVCFSSLIMEPQSQCLVVRLHILGL